MPARNFLKNRTNFLDSAISRKVGNLQLVPFVPAFKSMNKVVDCCFSVKEVGPHLDEHLLKLTKAFKIT